VTCVIFSRPTIAPREAVERGGDATCVGPAACGDVLRAHRDVATSIVLIDGYFEHTRSVRHKEVLWALSPGVRVYGASSLGALRAVALEPFGMVGVGQVFEWFREGVLEDDDEVALTHESSERDYRAVSDALVNLRVTLERAVHAGLLQAVDANALVQSQKSLFYPSRSLENAIAAGCEMDLDVDWPTFTRCLGGGRVDQKRLDAIEVLERARLDVATPPATVPPTFRFCTRRHGTSSSHARSGPVDAATTEAMNLIRLLVP
jgi:hypothetical protein